MSEKKYSRKQKKFNKTVDQISEGIEKKFSEKGRTKKEDRKQERKFKKLDKTAEQLGKIRAEGASKMPDGYNMKRPAEKLGYIQKLGAGRMSPGKMGDMTAMKMMHGDAAAKYYDGAGMYMNGAPKYEGASKSYMGAMKHVDGTNKGHEAADIPSYTRQTTTTRVVPGTKSSISTTTSGGGSQSKAKKSTGVSYKKAYEKADKKKYPTLESFTKASKEYNLKKGRSTSSSGGDTSSKSSKSTKPTVKTEVKKEKITSKRKSGSQVMSEGRETEMNRMARQKAGMAEMMNIAKKDSANVAQSYLKGKKITPEILTRAVKKGNIAGKKVLMGYGEDRGSFDQQGIGRAAEFRYDRSDAEKAFKTDIGKATGTSIGKGKAKGRKFESGQEFGLSGVNYTAGDIGKVKDFSKKGQYKITDVKTDAGSAGSYGGYSSAKEYMDALNKGGSPKMPKGPMKFGMKK
jgi:hypothetical protein